MPPSGQRSRRRRIRAFPCACRRTDGKTGLPAPAVRRCTGCPCPCKGFCRAGKSTAYRLRARPPACPLTAAHRHPSPSPERTFQAGSSALRHCGSPVPIPAAPQGFPHGTARKAPPLCRAHRSASARSDAPCTRGADPVFRPARLTPAQRRVHSCACPA